MWEMFVNDIVLEDIDYSANRSSVAETSKIEKVICSINELPTFRPGRDNHSMVIVQ